MIGTDHPRACGENLIYTAYRALSSGSPPRMRGKHELRSQRYLRQRITPAHAGKTQRYQELITAVTDHPRACGENQTRAQRSRAERDHPRACGENEALGCHVVVGGGSPPRMRGKLVLLSRHSQRARITPAHAGKTPASRRTCPQCPDHPRACGENAHGGEHLGDLFRITPAHAGKTVPAAELFSSYSDHPRACGENDDMDLKNKIGRGSPPRMRGKPERRAGTADG